VGRDALGWRLTAPTLARTADGAVRVPFAWARDFDAIQVNIYQRLWTEVGTALENAARGLPWMRWASEPSVGMPEIAAAVRLQLGAVAGVQAVQSVTPSRVAGVLSCPARCTVVLDGRPYSLSVVVADPYQTSGPPLFFQIGG
jgi:hypothetical protein